MYKKTFYTIGAFALTIAGLAFWLGTEVPEIALGASPTTYTITDASYTYALVGDTCAGGETHGTTSDGGQGDVYYATCTGRSDGHQLDLDKTLTWESMGVDVGDEVSTVDGSFLYRTAQESHAVTQGTGDLNIYAGATLCATLESSIDPGAVNASFTAHDATGAVSVDAACKASNTSIKIVIENVDPMVESGNNASAVSEVRWDDVSLVIVHAVPAAGGTVGQSVIWFD